MPTARLLTLKDFRPAQMDPYLAHVERYEYTFALEMDAFVAAVRRGEADSRAAHGLDGCAARPPAALVN